MGTLRKGPSYEELTMTQWLLGFHRIAEEEMDQVRKQNMYSYLIELMQLITAGQLQKVSTLC